MAPVFESGFLSPQIGYAASRNLKAALGARACAHYLCRLLKKDFKMFEVGKTYKFKWIVDGEELTMWGEVEHYDHPLLKTADHEPPTLVIDFGDGDEKKVVAPKSRSVIRGEIINVTSPNFISAQLQD